MKPIPSAAAVRFKIFISFLFLCPHHKPWYRVVNMTHINPPPKPTLFVCTNCPNERKAGLCGVPASEGEALLANLQTTASPSLLATANIAPVKCMGGCETPCSVAFTAPGKEALLFSHMGTQHVADILTCFTTYIANPAGHRLTKPERPESMRSTLAARIPTALL
jgi:predicted metal-binding protein